MEYPNIPSCHLIHSNANILRPYLGGGVHWVQGSGTPRNLKRIDTYYSLIMNYVTSLSIKTNDKHKSIINMYY